MINNLKSTISGFKDLITGPYKWFAIFFLVWLYRVEFMSDTGVGMGKILQVGTVFGLLYLLLREQPSIFKETIRYTNTPVKSMMLLFIYAVLSTLWALQPSFAFFLSFQNLLMVMLFTWAFSQFENFRDMERGALFFTVLIIVMEFIASRLGQQSLFNHILSSASLSAIMLAYCVGEYMACDKEDKERLSLLRVSSIVFLFNTIINTSGGANASVVMAIGVAMFFGGKKIYALLITIIGLVLFFNQELIDEIILTLMPGKDMATIKVGNGRDTIWENLLGYADQKPWLGWGFACIERVNQLGIIGGQSLSDAHSNYVGMYGSLGIVGCVLFGWHLLTTGWYLFKRKVQIGFLGLFAAFTCATVNGYSYGFLSGKTCSITVGYIMIVVLSFYYSIIPQEEETVTEDEQGAE